MKIGLSWFFIKPMPFDREVLLHYAKEADRLGFESIWIPEHAAIPHGYKTHYPYSVDGKLPTNDEEMPFPDPFITLAFAAGVTNRIKFGTNIAILPQRHPLYAAKELATLDVLSKGRVILGIGSGWLKEEFDALGIDYHKRGARTDECIQALRTLWRDDPASFDGKQIKFGPMRSFPGTVPERRDTDPCRRRLASGHPAHRALWRRLSAGAGRGPRRTVQAGAGRMQEDWPQSRRDRIQLSGPTDHGRRQAGAGFGRRARDHRDLLQPRPRSDHPGFGENRQRRPGQVVAVHYQAGTRGHLRVTSAGARFPVTRTGDVCPVGRNRLGW